MILSGIQEIYEFCIMLDSLDGSMTKKNAPNICSAYSSPWAPIISSTSPSASNVRGSVSTVWKRLASALSAELGEEEEEELGQQPWACCCHWFTAFEWFSPLPHVCVGFPLSAALSVASPVLSPSVLISHHLYPHNLFCSKSARCPTLLCSFPVFPFKQRWILPDIRWAFLLNGDCLVAIGFYSQKSTLISGLI